MLGAGERIPLVFLDRFDDTLPCDFVGTDNHIAARETTHYLLGLGHTRSAHLTQDMPTSSIRG